MTVSHLFAPSSPPRLSMPLSHHTVARHSDVLYACTNRISNQLHPSPMLMNIRWRRARASRGKYEAKLDDSLRSREEPNTEESEKDRLPQDVHGCQPCSGAPVQALCRPPKERKAPTSASLQNPNRFDLGLRWRPHIMVRAHGIRAKYHRTKD